MADYHGAASEGTRAQNLMKKREKQKEELEKIKQKISEVSIIEHNVIVYDSGTFCVRTSLGCWKQRKI